MGKREGEGMLLFSPPTDLYNDHLTSIRYWTKHREPGCAGDSASPPDTGLGVLLCGINSPDKLLLAKPLERVGSSQLGLGEVYWPGAGGSWVRDAAVHSWESYPGSGHLFPFG